MFERKYKPHQFCTGCKDLASRCTCPDVEPETDVTLSMHDRAVLQKFMGSPSTLDATNAPDMVDHPPHYTSHPSGVECIQIIEHMGFNLGNAIKYIWRADLKADALQDLEKALWYVKREIEKRSK